VSDTSEISEVKMLDSLPENLTHPDIQPYLFQRILEYLKKKNKSFRSE
jgi:hypothetical protein